MVPKRITFVISSLGCGGAERVMVDLVEAFSSAGYTSSLITFWPASADFYAPPHGVHRVVATGASTSCRWFDVRCQKERRRALRQSILSTDPDLVISFIDTANVAVLSALKYDNIPVVVVEHTDPRKHQIGWRWSLMRWYNYPTAARVVMVAPDTVKWARRFWPSWTVVNICNWVNYYQSVEVRNQDRVVCAMGRLAPEKGFDLLLQAFSTVIKDFPDWKLQIIGEGPDRSKLESQISASGLEKYVTLVGAVKNPVSLLAESSLFVFSSRYEAFGMALAEAMACGLPVISFDCPSGPGMIIRNEVDGLLVPPEDVNALAGAMRRLMGNPAESKRLASRAPEVRERFSPERIFGQWLALVDEVMTERK